MTAPAAPPSRWRAEPFRVFFPLAVVLGWAGVGHWLWYATGVAETYSCFAHGLVQMQAFMPALAAGFLLTALPRRTQSLPPSRAELGAIAALLVACAVAALAERPLLAEGAYLALLAVLARFAGRRLLGRGAGRRPPAAFVLVPLALLNGAVGALCVGLGDGQVIALGRLLVEQGVFLCLVVGVGALILPIVGGMPPPPDLDGTARARRALAGFAALGLAVDATFLAEVAGLARAAPLARAGLVAAGLAAAGAARRPAVPGFHRRLVWTGAWLTPAGLAAAALVPDYRVPALHVLFIGGFATLGFGVATHVSLGHLGLADAARGRPAPVVALAAGLFLALLARVAADWSDGYFTHLGWAAAAWTAGTAAWLAALGPRLLRR
jgi:uncharacterized protein involved in response to NO